MKLISRLLIIGVLSYFLPFYLPWWSVALVGFLAGFTLHGPVFNSFVSGFLGTGIVWVAMAWQIDRATSSFLTSQMAQLLTVESSLYVIIITGLLGALVGGLSCVTGNSFRQIFLKKKSRSLYS